MRATEGDAARGMDMPYARWNPGLRTKYFGFKNSSYLYQLPDLWSGQIARRAQV